MTNGPVRMRPMALRPNGRLSQRRPPADTSLRVSLTPTADAVRICLFGIMMVNISAIQMYMGPVRALRPGMTFLALALLLVVLKPKLVDWKNMMAAYPSKWVIVFFGLACGSALFGLSLGGSGSYILNVYSRNLIFFFLIVIAIRNVHDLALLMWSYVASVGVLVVLAQTVLDMEVTREGLGRLGGGQGLFDANDLGMILVMALPLALLFFFNGRPLTRMLSLGTMIGIPVTIALTGSRGALIGLVVVGITVLLTLRRVSVVKRVTILAGVAAGLFYAAPDGYWKQMSTLLNLKEDYNYSVEYGRKGIAKRGIGYMVGRPFFGVGVANFPRAEGTISPIANARLSEGQSVEWIAPHNTYVQVGAEMGIPALTIWLFLLLGGTVGLWRLRRRLPASWEHESAERKFLSDACLFLPISFLGFAVTSLFLSHGYTIVPYVIFAYLGGLHMLVRKELQQDPKNGAEAVTSRRGGYRTGSYRRAAWRGDSAAPKPMAR
jgi:O-antigen ligase